MQTITMMKVEQYPHVTAQGYTLKALKGIQGSITRFLWQSLEKLKALQPESISQEYVRYHPHHQDKMCEAFREQMMEMVGQGYSPDDLLLICGGEDFRELLADQELYRSGAFRVPMGDLQFGFGGYRGTLEDIPVHVVPHLKGYAIIEKVLVEKCNQSHFSLKDFNLSNKHESRF